MLEFSATPGIWLSCYRGIREGERESVDGTRDLVFCKTFAGDEACAFRRCI